MLVTRFLVSRRVKSFSFLDNQSWISFLEGFHLISFNTQYKTFLSHQNNHLLAIIYSLGVKDLGFFKIYQQNPKVSTYSIFSQGPKKVSLEMPWE